MFTLVEKHEFTYKKLKHSVTILQSQAHGTLTLSREKGNTMATSLEGNNLDSAGNVAVDFVWGNFPIQPNDLRTAGTPTATVTVSGSQNVGWTTTSTVNSALLNYAYDSHAIAEANYSGHPGFIAADPVLRVTAASGNGTTVTYTAQNPNFLFAAGQNVTITGCTTSAFNLTNATIATANAYQFTVTNSAGSGVSITGQTAIAQLGAGAADSDGSYVGGVAYVTVPSVIGQTTANATAILTDLELVPTTATAATNTPISVTAASRTASSATATVTATGAGAAFPVGTKITIAGLADATTTELNGTWTVTANATNTVSFVSNATTAIAVASPTGTPTVKGTTATVKTQSIAAGTASTAAGAAITITPWA